MGRDSNGGKKNVFQKLGAAFYPLLDIRVTIIKVDNIKVTIIKVTIIKVNKG